ncbi:hypothetical protein ACMHYO_20395 [Allopusillimonas ginsengisoli]|uniref:hypothetical protein n=1 Tax=Allopusillimonas ginsengisoli TaxID=453575 RepID=UPI0039C4D896
MLKHSQTIKNCHTSHRLTYGLKLPLVTRTWYGLSNLHPHLRHIANWQLNQSDFQRAAESGHCFISFQHPRILKRPSRHARAIYTSAKPPLEARAQALNTRLLYLTPWSPSGIWSVKPEANAEDLKNLKIRTYDQTSKAVFQNLR